MLAIIAAGMRLLLSAKQDLLRMVRAFRDIERGRFVNFGKLDLGSWGHIRNLGPMSRRLWLWHFCKINASRKTAAPTKAPTSV